MADIPLEKGPQKDQEIKITAENAALYTAFYMIQTYKRLGYLIKLLEQRKNG
jgi:hypothetical protein